MIWTKRNQSRKPKSLAQRIVSGILKGVGYTAASSLVLLVVLLCMHEDTMPLPKRMVNDSAKLLPAEAERRLEVLLQAYKAQHGVSVYIGTKQLPSDLDAVPIAESIGTNWQKDGIPVEYFLFLATNGQASGRSDSERESSLAEVARSYAKWVERLEQDYTTAPVGMPAQASAMLGSLQAASMQLAGANSSNAGAVQGAIWGCNTRLRQLARPSMLQLAEWGDMELALAAGALSIIAYNPDTLRSARMEMPESDKAHHAEGGPMRVWTLGGFLFLLAGIAIALWKRKRPSMPISPATERSPKTVSNLMARPVEHAEETNPAPISSPSAEVERATCEAPLAPPEQREKQAPRNGRRENAKGCFKALLALVILATLALYLQSIPKSGDRLRAPNGEYYLLPPPRNYVNDSGHVLEEAEEIRLEKLLRNYEYNTSAEIFVVTTRQTMGYDANAFATILGNQWKVGKPGKENGMVLYVNASQMPPWDASDTASRPAGYYGEGYLAVGADIEPYITDAQCMQLVRRHVAPAVAGHRYEEGLRACVQDIIDRTAPLERAYTETNEFAQRRVKEEPLTVEVLEKGILGWLADTLMLMLLVALILSPIIAICYPFRRDKSERFSRFYFRWMGKVLLVVVFFSFRGTAAKTSKLAESGAQGAGGALGGAGGGVRV